MEEFSLVIGDITIPVSEGLIGDSLQFVPNRFKDESLCRNAVDEHGSAIRFVPTSFIDKRMALSAVRSFGPALGWIPPEFRDYAVCLRAARNWELSSLAEHIPKEILTELRKK